MLPLLPSWVTSPRSEALEAVAFLAGAALSHLHLVVNHPAVPQGLLRDRLALQSAETCMSFSGRPERVGELRDAVCLMKSGDLPGPAGESFLAWRRAAQQPVSLASLRRVFPNHDPVKLADWLDAGQGDPVSKATCVIQMILDEQARDVMTALVLADSVLARALGWDHLVPILAHSLKRGDLRKREDELMLACHRAVVSGCIEAVRMAHNLARRAAHLKSVAPKLRAKGAGEAIEMFLTRDAVTPVALPLPDRSARRLCDRLVELGAIRELTGREMFRIYGV
ncbi:DUF1403 family protein [Marivita sp.]|uniref:DUF1403 family protein n=1 Tax=Marivita sp. TaxID=2003365 RepID=UPI003B51EBE2